MKAERVDDRCAVCGKPGSVYRGSLARSWKPEIGHWRSICGRCDLREYLAEGGQLWANVDARGAQQFEAAMNDLYEEVLRYFFWSYRLVIRGLAEEPAIRFLRSRAVEGGGGFWGPSRSAKMTWPNHHIQAWNGREDGPPVIDVTAEKAARDAWALLYAPARQERLL